MRRPNTPTYPHTQKQIHVRLVLNILINCLSFIFFLSFKWTTQSLGICDVILYTQLEYVVESRTEIKFPLRYTLDFRDLFLETLRHHIHSFPLLEPTQASHIFLNQISLMSKNLLLRNFYCVP